MCIYVYACMHKAPIVGALHIPSTEGALYTHTYTSMHILFFFPTDTGVLHKALIERGFAKPYTEWFVPIKGASQSPLYRRGFAKPLCRGWVLAEVCDQIYIHYREILMRRSIPVRKLKRQECASRHLNILCIKCQSKRLCKRPKKEGLWRHYRGGSLQSIYIEVGSL